MPREASSPLEHYELGPRHGPSEEPTGLGSLSQILQEETFSTYFAIKTVRSSREDTSRLAESLHSRLPAQGASCSSAHSSLSHHSTALVKRVLPMEFLAVLLLKH
ncbi:UNVERIFIED_CONTAM: hypothetical protein K2H54_057082 [Gekko kuhli]